MEGVSELPPAFDQLNLPPRYERPPVYREEPLPIGSTPLLQRYYREFQGRIVAEGGSNFEPTFKTLTTKYVVAQNTL